MPVRFCWAKAPNRSSCMAPGVGSVLGVGKCKWTETRVPGAQHSPTLVSLVRAFLVGDGVQAGGPCQAGIEARLCSEAALAHWVLCSHPPARHRLWTRTGSNPH